MLSQRKLHRGWLFGDEAHRSRLVEFNYRPAAWARPERLYRLCAEDASVTLLKALDFDFLRTNARMERRLSRWIVSRWALAEPYAFMFEPVETRVALVSTEALAALAESLGLVCHSETIRHGIRRETRERMVREFGESRWRYALSAAVVHGRQPWRFSGAEEAVPADSLTLDHVRKTGWRCVSACLAGAPPAVLRRVELKLPPDIELAGGAASGEVREPRTEWWPAMERILRLEHPGEWRACCC